MHGSPLAGRAPAPARGRTARWARAALAAAAIAAAGGALADPFLGRGGASGLLDVPDGETVPRGVGRLAMEWGWDDRRETHSAFGPMPLAVAVGLASRFEAGFSLRDPALPEDPEPSALAVGVSAKAHLLDAGARRPALALAVGADRLNVRPDPTVRLAASTDAEKRLRFAAHVGAERGERVGPAAGVAVAFRLGRVELVADALTRREGSALGAALRTSVGRAGWSLGLSSAPGGGFRVSVGVALEGAIPGAQAARRTRSAAPEAPPPAAPAAPAEPVEERTHGRLRLPEARVPGDRPGASPP